MNIPIIVLGFFPTSQKGGYCGELQGSIYTHHADAIIFQSLSFSFITSLLLGNIISEGKCFTA